MNKGQRHRLFGISLVILFTLVTADLVIRIWPGLVEKPVRFVRQVHAQDSDARPRTAPIFFPEFSIEEGRTRLFHVSYIVDDLENSIEFYRDVLGFKHIRTQDMGFQRIAFISTGDGEPQIELKEVTAPFRGMPTEGFSHVGIFVQDVDAIYEKSIEYGAEWRMKPTVLGPGAPYFGSMRDPDGYEIEVMENPTGGCVSCHRGPHLN
jgi:catechol 2,3-dioxygenase-like lactoylglutathione lyase family enzyme